MRTITISEQNQLRMAAFTVRESLDDARRLLETVMYYVPKPEPDSKWGSVPAQNIKREVEAVCSAIEHLHEILGGALSMPDLPSPPATGLR